MLALALVWLLETVRTFVCIQNIFRPAITYISPKVSMMMSVLGACCWFSQVNMHNDSKYARRHVTAPADR